MPTGLRRYQESGAPHIPFSCVRHRPILSTAEARGVFPGLLDRTRELSGMNIYAYVAMTRWPFRRSPQF
jgi:hypothetical protein